MQYKTGLASAALLAASVSAQSNSSSNVPSSCSISSSATATSQAELDRYSSCQKVVGDLVISGDLGTAALANVQELDGSLKISNATKLTSFSADSLKTITKSLEFDGLTILSTASFGSLERVGSLHLTSVPALEALNTKLRSADEIVISDTALRSLEGFESMDTIQIFNINNNRNLGKFNSKLKYVYNSLDVGFNDRNANFTFDKLVSANNITLRSMEGASFKSLKEVNSSLNFLENNFETIDLSSLSKIGGSLSIARNNELTSVSFENVTEIGGALVVANNSRLAQIEGFSNLKNVGGALEIVGNFSSLSLGKLNNVRGGARVDTTSSNFSCDALNSLQKEGRIQGDRFVCKNGASSTSVHLSGSASATNSGARASATGSSSASASAGGSETSSKGAAAHFSPATSFMGAVAAVAVALL